MAALESASLASALPPLVDSCINYAKTLHDEIHTFNNGGMIRGDECMTYSHQLEVSLLLVKDILQFLSSPLSSAIEMALFQLNAALKATIRLADESLDNMGKVPNPWFTLYCKLKRSLREVNRSHDILLRSLQIAVLFGGNKVETITAEHIERTPSLVTIQNLKNTTVGSLKDATVRFEMEDLPKGSLEPLHIRFNICYLGPLDRNLGPGLIHQEKI